MDDVGWIWLTDVALWAMGREWILWFGDGGFTRWGETRMGVVVRVWYVGREICREALGGGRVVWGDSGDGRGLWYCGLVVLWFFCVYKVKVTG